MSEEGAPENQRGEISPPEFNGNEIEGSNVSAGSTNDSVGNINAKSFEEKVAEAVAHILEEKQKLNDEMRKAFELNEEKRREAEKIKAEELQKKKEKEARLALKRKFINYIVKENNFLIVCLPIFIVALVVILLPIMNVQKLWVLFLTAGIPLHVYLTISLDLCSIERFLKNGNIKEDKLTKSFDSLLNLTWAIRYNCTENYLRHKYESLIAEYVN